MPACTPREIFYRSIYVYLSNKVEIFRRRWWFVSQARDFDSVTECWIRRHGCTVSTRVNARQHHVGIRSMPRQHRVNVTSVSCQCHIGVAALPIHWRGIYVGRTGQRGILRFARLDVVSDSWVNRILLSWITGLILLSLCNSVSEIKRTRRRAERDKTT